MRSWIVVVLVVVGALARQAGAGERTELYMYAAVAGAPDDAPAERSFIGSMASGSVCAAVAEALGRQTARDQRRGVGVFVCEDH